MRKDLLLALACGLVLTGCQSSGENNASLLPSASTEQKASSETMAAASTGASPQCAIPLAGGPPPKPDKAADFAQNAVGKNVARNVGRNAISRIGASIAGPLGGAVGSAVAVQTIRTEQDLHGRWFATDGSNNCGCEVEVTTGAGLVPVGYFRTSGYKIKDAKGGRVKNVNCNNPQIASISSFALGYSFTGYDAKLALQDSKGAGVGLLTRDGINYFSGTLANGTPITVWRR